ncbi:DUF4279 domain-containing protein [Noviluteimonas dokdonensis]|uniref:DUF4279 domain-containing protein n=1 Tax=Noviluteimonas dokdonensis TaxID=414050 RepID=UPI001269D7BA|nr:DUF4279 domain-containing protein [Lysobacter dokdonensis]
MKEYSISLRIKHPTAPGDDIAALIGRPPLVVQNVGRQRVTPKGNLVGRINDESSCVFRLLDHGRGVFVDGIEAMLPELLQLSGTFAWIAETGGVAELYVFIFPEDDNNLGFTLSPEVIADLNRLRLELSVEILLLDDD